MLHESCILHSDYLSFIASLLCFDFRLEGVSASTGSYGQAGEDSVLTLLSSMTVSLIMSRTWFASGPATVTLLSCSLLAPMANLVPSGEKARAEMEVGYLGYCFIRFLVK